MELYDGRVKELGRRKADIRFVMDVLLLFRPGIIGPTEGSKTLNIYSMYKSYFKIAWRNLSRNKGYSLINIGGLAVGMSVAIIISLWVQYERSFDSFHENKGRIALVMKHALYQDEKETVEQLPLPLYEELKSNFPEVKGITRIAWAYEKILITGETKLKKNGKYVDPDFLKMLSFPLLKGNIDKALSNPHSIIITESLASILFGDDDPLGQLIKMGDARAGNQYDLQVTGILKNIPNNSSLEFEFLVPYELEAQTSQFVKDHISRWDNNSVMYMVEMREGVSMDDFSKKIAPLITVKNNAIVNQTLFLHPMSKWRLYSKYENWENTGGKIEYVRLFGIIGVFVLLIACINFMNLTTARSEKRAKEIGIRKVIGSQRSQLITQLLSESVLTSLLAFVISIGIVWSSLPFLKELGFESIQFDLRNISVPLSALLICLVTALFAGSYPALYLSSFVPSRALKGVIQHHKGPVTFRRVLVVSQFVISIILIISTVIVFQQIRHAKNRPLGYEPDNLISIRGSADLAKNYSALKQELLGTGVVESVVKASCDMTRIANQWGGFSWDEKDPNLNEVLFDIVMAEWDFEKTVGLTFKQGRPFSVDHPSDSNAVILNETALKTIGYEDPIGKTISKSGEDFTIIGIVDDMLMLDPFKPVPPTMIMLNANAINVIMLRLKKTDDLQNSMTTIQPIFEKYNPSLPYEYSFVNDDFNKKFITENQVGKLGGIFSTLAIVISYLGLFGLSAYVVEQRTKEIGIRKILGASISNIWKMLSRDFVMLVLVSCFIAIPVAWYFMDGWLEKYEYRTEISWRVFVMTIAGTLTITLLTVSFQSIKAAVTNPVNSLRSE